MIRKLLMAGVLLAFLSAGSYAFAEDVFVTQNGAKYHKAICRLVEKKENVSKLDKQEAVDQGYTPCKRCFKEDVVVEEKE